MAMSTYCSLNLNPPPSSTSVSSPISRITQLACPPREGSWRKRCLLGLTCAIIGLELGDFAVMCDQASAKAMDIELVSKIVIQVPPRWSDKRTCLPWRLNSLETIVPENLPRPSARRRWEANGLSEAAPPVMVVTKSDARGCFNL